MMELVNLSKFSSTHSLQLVNKYFSSVFYFSILLLCSSIFPFIINFMQFFFSSIGKNYMFLVCNGILVFIAKFSGLIGNSYQETSPIEKTEERIVVEVKAEQETEHKSLIMEKEGKSFSLITQDRDCEIIALDEEENQEEEEEEEEEEVELLSAEELNKKCDDFIRKMKEEIKSEAQELIMSVQY